MSEQQAPSQHEDSPAVAGPNEAPGTAQEQAEVDWQKRYTDTQAEYSRGQQAMKEQKQWLDLLVTSDDPDTQRQALQALGYDVPDETETEDVEPAEYEDPYDQIDDRFQRIEERFTQQDQQEKQAAEHEFITGYAHDQLDQLGISRDDDQTRQWVFERALSLQHLPPMPGAPANWLPDMKAAHEQYQAWRDAEQKQWAKTKRAPYVASGGVSATEAPLPLDANHDQRTQFALQKLAERGDAGG